MKNRDAIEMNWKYKFGSWGPQQKKVVQVLEQLWKSHEDDQWAEKPLLWRKIEGDRLV